MKPLLLLEQAWMAYPWRIPVGLAGFALVVWSILPLFGQRTSDNPLLFAEEMGGVWQRDRVRAAIGLIGTALCLWSAWPIVTMP